MMMYVKKYEMMLLYEGGDGCLRYNIGSICGK